MIAMGRSVVNRCLTTLAGCTTLRRTATLSNGRPTSLATTLFSVISRPNKLQRAKAMHKIDGEGTFPSGTTASNEDVKQAERRVR